MTETAPVVCSTCVSYYNRVCFYLHIPMPRESESFAEECSYFKRRRPDSPVRAQTRRERRGGVQDDS